MSEMTQPEWMKGFVPSAVRKAGPPPLPQQSQTPPTTTPEWLNPD